MKKMLHKAASRLGYEIRRTQPKRGLYGLEMLNKLRGEPSNDGDLEKFLRFTEQSLSRSKSQLFQDLFVLFALDQKRSGYFVEFGAADGRFLSNTILLEQDQGWHGIVCEPSAKWHADLSASRKCRIDLRCVWNQTGKTLRFSEAPDAVLSTISDFASLDGHDRSGSKEYLVETVSLNDLLIQHQAPRKMDYLSIDTEGSELTILKSFDFTRWSFQIITVEHNFTRARDEIYSLLVSKGYARVFENVTLQDDWYVMA